MSNITKPCPHCNNAFERLLCRICSGTGLVVDEHAAQRNQDIKTAHYVNATLVIVIALMFIVWFSWVVSR